MKMQPQTEPLKYDVGLPNLAPQRVHDAVFFSVALKNENSD